MAAEQRAAHDVFQVLAREGLDQVLEGAVGERVLDRFERRVGRDHDDFDGGIDALDAPEELEPVELGHLDVHDDDVWPEPLQRVERRAAVLRRLDVVRGLEEHSERFRRAELVVDDEDTRERGRRGDGAHAPATGRDPTNASSLRACRTRRSPPRASTSRWLTAGPTSIRLSWTIWTGSNRRCSLSGGTLAVRDPMKIRTLSPTPFSVCRPTDTDTRACSGGELCVRYQTRYESAFRSCATSTLTVSGAESRVTSSWIGLPSPSSAMSIAATTSSTTACTSTVVKFNSPSVTSAASFSKTSTSRRTSRPTTEEKCLRKSGSS